MSRAILANLADHKPTADGIRASIAEANARLDQSAREVRERDYPLNRSFK